MENQGEKPCCKESNICSEFTFRKLSSHVELHLLFFFCPSCHLDNEKTDTLSKQQNKIIDSQIYVLDYMVIFLILKQKNKSPTLWDPWTIQTSKFSRPEYCLQGIFPTQGSNPGLPALQADFFTSWTPKDSSLIAQLVKNLLAMQETTVQFLGQGIPRILKWVAYPFSRGSS